MLILVSGLLGTMLGLSNLKVSNRFAHNPSTIPIQPGIAQLQAIESVEEIIRMKIDGVKQVYLYFSSFNSTAANPHQNPELTPMGWNLQYVNAHPDALNLPPIFIHTYGTI